MGKSFYLLLIAAISSLFNPAIAAANASLYLFPPSGTYSVGQPFNVSVNVDPGSLGINAAEGVLVFNPSELQVVSISKTNSFFTLWTKDPSFSNSAGNIEFGGGTQTAFTGSNGKILTITFKPKVSASSQVNFSSGSVLAADGLGSNVLGTMQGGLYTFAAKNIGLNPDQQSASVTGQQIQTNLPVDTGITAGANTPKAPIINSSTHPDPEQWYNKNDVELSWSIPEGITGVRASLNHELVSLPNITNSLDTTEKKIDDLEDGVWYFHLQFKNSKGWGSIAHRKIMIDTHPAAPFDISVEGNDDATDPSPTFKFKTTDDESGISSYELRVDLNDVVKLSPEMIESEPYHSLVLSAGRHMVVIKAIDMAGNSTLSMAEFEIPTMECPAIIDAPGKIGVNNQIIFKGSSMYKGATATAIISKNDTIIASQKVKTDNNGNWSIFFPDDLKLNEGNYKAIIGISSVKGGQSKGCDAINFTIEASLIARIFIFIIKYLSLFVLIMVLLAVNVAIYMFSWHRIMAWHNRIKRETDEADDTVSKSFETLGRQSDKEMDHIDNLPVTTEREKEIKARLKAAINNAEDKIKKEIDDIENEL